MNIALCLALVRHIWNAESCLGLPSVRDILEQKITRTGRGWSLCAQEKAERNATLQLGGENTQVPLIAA